MSQAAGLGNQGGTGTYGHKGMSGFGGGVLTWVPRKRRLGSILEWPMEPRVKSPFSPQYSDPSPYYVPCAEPELMVHCPLPPSP
jgi:hypothetical protein